ncbi:protein kinase [Streptomyces diacarni]|uniref:protein kinase domain-containing protein n=1 Tax=Streptomyces diacarni TaxID=2800381 RepID=UPI0033C456A9
MTLRLPIGYRVGAWEVRESIASGAFGSVYEGQRVSVPEEPHGNVHEETQGDVHEGQHGSAREPQPDVQEEPRGSVGEERLESARNDPQDSVHEGTQSNIRGRRHDRARRKPHMRAREEAHGEVGGPPGGEPSRAALKFLPTGTRTPRQLDHLRDLTEREVALLRAVQRPRLIRMHEVLTVDDPERPDVDGACVLVLERAHTSVERMLAHGGLIQAALLAQVCEGLVQLHSAGWVHGDLKPANVLLMRDSTVRLCDFNLAAELEGTHAYSPAFSTPDYTPPELLWSDIGERGQRIRPSTDVWAFGVLAHLVLTGDFPFPGSTSSARRDAVLRYARGGEGLRLSDELPDAWRGIVTDCLAPTHEERARHDARSLLPRTEEAAGTARAARPRSRRRRFGLSLAAGLTGLGLVAGTAAVTATLVDDGSGTHSTAEPTGYDRCERGYVCFFTEPAGQGDMCSWFGFDEDWRTGTIRCPWSARQAPRSVFNNGTQGKHTAVAYFHHDDHHGREGCISRLARTDLPADLPEIRSHSWVKSC